MAGVNGIDVSLLPPYICVCVCSLSKLNEQMRFVHFGTVSLFSSKEFFFPKRMDGSLTMKGIRLIGLKVSLHNLLLILWLLKLKKILKIVRMRLKIILKAVAMRIPIQMTAIVMKKAVFISSYF